MKRLSWAPLSVLLLAGIGVAQRVEDLLPVRTEIPSTIARDAGEDPEARNRPAALPGSPGALSVVLSETGSAELPQESKPDHRPAPCARTQHGDAQGQVAPVTPQEAQVPCTERINPYRRFLDTTTPVLLTPKQKAYLATRNFIDPFNLLTVAGNSAFTVGLDAHTGYGPGMAGFGRSMGYSLLQDATGEFIGTFAVCSLFHQDPHYQRMPHASPLRRVVHAVGRTVIAQHDNGSLMPNYENFISYPVSAEISNLYVPGVHGNGPSTVARIMTGLATDPANNLITEFLPDLARRVHIRVVFVQQILNGVARGDE